MEIPPPPLPSPPAIKPKSLLIFGVINLIWGAFNLMSVVPSLYIFLSPEAHQDNPVIQVMQKNPTYALFQKSVMVPGFLLVLVQLMGGIGLLKGREWGRKLSILWASIIIPFTPVVTYMTVVHVYPTMIEHVTAQLAQKGSGSPAIISGMATGMKVTAIGVAVLLIIYAIMLIAMLSRAKVKAYCRPGSQLSPQAPPPIPSR